jgi:hypothetical protein
VRAGDYIRISDRAGDAPRKIVTTSYDHSSRTLTATVGQGPLYRLDGLLQRVAVRQGTLGTLG